MNLYNLPALSRDHGGEYVLGARDLGTHACYLIYGCLSAGERGRVISPGRGHEEIVCLIEGQVVLKSHSRTFALRKGQAFHLTGEDSYHMDNDGQSDAIYVIAGGHSEPHPH